MEEGKLVLVATPIGNLEDISLRALRTLQDADVILAEDTRALQNLLFRHDIAAKSVLSFFEGNEERRILQVLRMLGEDKTIALVSESGTPLISDPGYKLVREAISRGIEVESIPGPTALIAALTVSALPPDKFIFLGFLPKKPGKARKLLENSKNLGYTTILYESPHRLLRTLHLIEELFGDIKIVIARELTKVHKEVRREKVSKTIVHFNEVKPRGEFVVLFSLD